MSLRANKVPLPRPASVELSQSLHSYLSTVFDVNWSVAQSNTEDSFVTAPTSNHLSSSYSTSGSPSSSRSQAFSPRKPSLGQRTIESIMEPEQNNATTTSIARRHNKDSRQEGLDIYCCDSDGRSTDINYRVDESHQQRQSDSRSDIASSSQHRHGGSKKNNKVVSSPWAGPESRTRPPRPSTPPPRPSTPPPKKALTTSMTAATTKTPEKYAPPRPERPSSPSAMPYTLSFDPDPSLLMQQSNYAVSTAYEPASIGPQQHIHNHIHIHVHNYPPPEAAGAATTTTTLSTSPPHRPITPPPRSSRYPKPPPPRPTTTTTTTTTTTEYISYTTDYSTSIHSQWATADPKAILAATAAATVNLPPTWQPVSLESLLPSTMTTSTASYPPEKSAGGLLDSRGVEEEEGEQPYLATSLPTTSRYPRSPPPPPYTQSPIGSSFAAPLSPSMSPATFSPYEAYASKQQQSAFMPVLTTQPQSAMTSDASASANQKLLEYKQYQERQKMFARGDDSEKDESSKLDGLGFIRRLSRQSSKKKSPFASISAPLPSTLSYSSSSAFSTTSLSVAVPLHTIGGGLERYHDDQQQSSYSKGVDVSGNARYSIQPAAKNAVSMLKGTLSSVKSGLSRSSSPIPYSGSSIGPIGPPMTMSSSALSYGVVKASCAGPQQMYHYPAPSTSASPGSSQTMTTTVL